MAEHALLESVNTSEPTPARPIHWTFWKRVTFRFVFSYFMLYALCSGNATVWGVIPQIGDAIENGLSWPFIHAAEWLAQHWLHVLGLAGKIHNSGSGDRLLDWLSLGVMLAVALTACLVWTLLDRRRRQYQTLFAWFRFTLRLTLGVAMFNYGLAKLFPLQMSPPSLAVLNEPFGNISPMTLLWTMIGMNPLYEMVCGAAEIAGGLLILFRRTALLGALLTAFVVTNVVLYNFFFDVPVKIYAAHLLLMSLVIVTPDLQALVDFFWRHTPSAPSGIWVPPASRKRFRVATIGIEGFFLFMCAVVAPFTYYKSYTAQRASALRPSPLTGHWHVDSIMLTSDGKPAPYLTGDGLPATDIFLEPFGRTMIRASDNALWRSSAKYDSTKRTFVLSSNGHAGSITYAVLQADSAHLLLTPTGKEEKTEAVLRLTRVPLPATYPLLTRGFHFVNEWGLER
ncbi:MAG: hypothetical protein ABJB66_20635 [Gemmatimonadaceae bacterium]